MTSRLQHRLILISVAFALCSPAQAQQVKTPAKIGWLGARAGATPDSGRELFRREFQKLGYVDQRDFIIESRYAEGKLDRLPQLASELVSVGVDLILAAATPEALAARNATKTTPIVFFGAADPVAAGLVDRLAHPGGNLTGFTNSASALTAKRLEIVIETVSKLSRLVVLWDPKNGGSIEQWKEHQTAGRELGLQLQSLPVSSSDQFEDGFRGVVEYRRTALSATSNPLFASNVQKIAVLAKKYRLPSMFPNFLYVDAGGLISYGQDRNEPYRRAAVYVDRILKGASPADLPVEQPTKFELVINLKTAKQLDLIIPPNVLARADRIIR